MHSPTVRTAERVVVHLRAVLVAARQSQRVAAASRAAADWDALAQASVEVQCEFRAPRCAVRARYRAAAARDHAHCDPRHDRAPPYAREAPAAAGYGRSCAREAQVMEEYGRLCANQGARPRACSPAAGFPVASLAGGWAGGMRRCHAIRAARLCRRACSGERLAVSARRRWSKGAARLREGLARVKETSTEERSAAS